MTNGVPWRPLLRDALAVLALPIAEQIRANGPGGCIACDLLIDFDHARTVAIANGDLSDDQRDILDAIDGSMRSMQQPDHECFNNDVLGREAWAQLRELAAQALQRFSWTNTVVKPFVEVTPGIWHRPPIKDEDLAQ